MCLRGLLQGQNGSALPTVRLPGHVGLDLADEPGEREAADQQVGRILIGSDLLQGLLTCDSVNIIRIICMRDMINSKTVEA